MAYWLFKSEPDVFGIDHLKAMPGKKDHWDGVRNYQARNMMRDQMVKGETAFFYHSSCPEPGIVGTVTICSAPYPDHTALDPTSKYYDPKATEDNPRWYMVDVRYKKKFKRVITLQELKETKGLEEMPLVKKGNRLSILPVSEKEWDIINGLV